MDNCFDYEGYKSELIGLKEFATQLSIETSSRLEKLSYESMHNAFDIAIKRLDDFKK